MGCRLNLAEGAEIERAAMAAGLDDTVVINTCGVTNEAVRQSRQHIRKARRERPDAAIFVTGCAAQIDPAPFAAMPEVAGVLGNDEKHKADAWRSLRDDVDPAPVRVNDIMSVRATAPQLIDAYGDRARAFLQVQNGCDHRCTFCIIPYGRGNSRSAPIADVVEKAKTMAANGHHELVFTGVDITSWGADLEGAPVLGDLVDAVLRETPTSVRLRLSSIDGAEIDPVLRRLIENEMRIAPHVHLSVQSGSDMILKRMKRRHTRQDMIDLCQGLRAARPEIAFGADIIAGFPTETEAMFDDSLALVDQAGLNYLHVFPYSARQGTPAARMPQVNGATIKDRARRLREKGEAATIDFLDGLVGGVFQGVLESGGRARLGNFAQAAIDDRGGAQVGDLVDVSVEGRDGLILRGAIRSPASQSPDIQAKEKGAGR